MINLYVHPNKQNTLKDKLKIIKEIISNKLTIDELAEIYDDVSYELKRVAAERNTSLPLSKYETVFVALVNLSKEWNSEEEAIFDFIYKKLFGLSFDGGKSYTQITNVINRLNKNHQIFMLDSYTKKYYASIAHNTFISYCKFSTKND